MIVILPFTVNLEYSIHGQYPSIVAHRLTPKISNCRTYHRAAHEYCQAMELVMPVGQKVFSLA